MGSRSVLAVTSAERAVAELVTDLAGSVEKTYMQFDARNADRTNWYSQARLTKASPAYQKAYSGVTLIENYLQFNAQLGITADIYRHFRLRLAFDYLRSQGHIVTMDDAGTTNYADRNTLNNATCDAGRVDLLQVLIEQVA